MLKEDWIEYFEALNGRKPSPAEFKAGLERGEFNLSQPSPVTETPSPKEAVSEPSPAAKGKAEKTVTAKAKRDRKAKTKKAPAPKAVPEDVVKAKRQALSSQAGDKAETIQSTYTPKAKEAIEAQVTATDTQEKPLAAHAPTRPDASYRATLASTNEEPSIPVFSNVSPGSSDKGESDLKQAKEEEKSAQKAARQAAKNKKKAERLVAKAKQREEKQATKARQAEERAAAKAEKKQANTRQKQVTSSESDAEDKVKQTDTAKNKGCVRGVLISSVVVVILMLVLGGGYGFWRNASGNIQGTWELTKSQALNEETGKLVDDLKKYEEANKVYTAFLVVDSQNQMVTHTYNYPKGDKHSPIFTASDYLNSYQTIDQWNRAVTYSMSVSDFKAQLVSAVHKLYPKAEQKLVDNYIKENVDTYTKYRKGDMTKTYTVDGDTLIVSTYNEDGKLTSRDTYRKASSSKEKQLESDYKEAKADYEKNQSISSN